MADEQIGECPIMILGNKIDKAGAASEDEIRHYFGLHGRTTGRVSFIQSNRLSIINGMIKGGQFTFLIGDPLMPQYQGAADIMKIGYIIQT